MLYFTIPHHKFPNICNLFLFTSGSQNYSFHKCYSIHSLQKLSSSAMIIVALFKKTFISSQESLLYLSFLIIVLNISLTWQNSAHQRTPSDHMFPWLLKAYRGKPQFGTQMPGSRNLALSCFVLNEVNEMGKRGYFLFWFSPCTFYLAF